MCRKVDGGNKMKRPIILSTLILLLAWTPQAVWGESFRTVKRNMGTEGEMLCYWEVRVLSIHLGSGVPPEGTYSLPDVNGWLMKNPEWEPFSASPLITNPNAQERTTSSHTMGIILRRRVCR
jgi:hypothetical protein